MRTEAQALHALSPLRRQRLSGAGPSGAAVDVLVLLMGALGSLLYLFPAYLNRPCR